MTDRPSALTGPAFPFRVAGGRVARRSAEDKVRDDVRHLLATRPGERLLRRAYGGGPHRRLQEPQTTALLSLVRHEIELALRQHLPQLRLVGPVHAESDRGGGLRVALDYRLPPDDVVRHLALDLTEGARLP